MEGKVQQVRWTEKASASLEEIYAHYAAKSLQAAGNVVADIITTAESIRYPEQYQADQINPKYRRMVVRDYKILYRTEGLTVLIVNIVSTRQSPEVLKSE